MASITPGCMFGNLFPIFSVDLRVPRVLLCAQHAEKMRVRALRAIAAQEEAEIERDRALELTLEVLRRKQADKRRGINRSCSTQGGKDKLIWANI